MKILVINGPNIQLLGQRKPEVYGTETLGDVENRLAELAKVLEVDLECYQSNHEGDIVDKIASAMTEGIAGIIINPAAYTHSSVAIRDALEAVDIPALEVHISNIHARDDFRKKSFTAPVCIGQICGLGTDGYEWAFRAMVKKLKTQK
jgi:3-dehydroquinate dehydratase-2